MRTVNKIKILCITTSISLFMTVASPLNANAYDITTNVSPTGNAWEWGSGTGWLQAQSNNGGESNNQSTGDAIFWGRFMNNSYTNNYWILKSVVSGNNIEFVEGNYYKTILSFNVVAPTSNAGIQLPILNRLLMPANAPYKLVSITPLEITCVDSFSGTIRTPNGVGDISAISGCFRGAISYDIIVQATRTDTGKLQLGDGASWFFQSLVGVSAGTGYGTLRPLTITEYKPDNVSVINEEQQEAGQQAQTDGNNAGNQAQTDADQGTAPLFTTIGNVLGAITDTPAGDCTLNGDMGNIDLGTLNLCQAEIGPLRPIIQAVLYLVMALATYKIMMWVIGSIAGLINWVQTGQEGRETDG